MSARYALVWLVASTLAIAVVYLAILLPGGTPGWTAPLMIAAVATQMVSVAGLGASRAGKLGKVALPLAAAWIIMVLFFGLALALPADTASAPHLLLGLPRRTALILFGVGLLPLLAMPLAYALTFDQMTLSEEQLRQLRAEAARINAQSEPTRAEVIR